MNFENMISQSPDALFSKKTGNRRPFMYFIFFFTKKLFQGLLFFFIILYASNAQTRKIDSLKKRVIVSTNAIQQSDALLALCEESHSMNIDTLFHYVSLLKQMALAAGDSKKEILANVFAETWLVRKNLLDSALQICNRDLQNISYQSAGQAYARVNMQKCFILMKSNKLQEALAYTYHFLNDAEKQQDTVSEIYCKYIIGTVYRNMQQTDLALQWYYKAANTGTGSAYDDIKNAFAVFLQMGGMYNWKAVADSVQKDVTADSAMSLYFLDKTIAYSRKTENIAILARALCMKADALEDSAHMSLARKLP
jgi:hypothetical protein